MRGDERMKGGEGGELTVWEKEEGKLDASSSKTKEEKEKASRLNFIRQVTALIFEVDTLCRESDLST